MPVPYLQNKPAVLPINNGRQLFVDSFLISSTNLRSVYHTPNFYKGNPVLEPTEKWENTTEGAPYAAPFSDGIWYDEKEGIFKMWYLAGAGTMHKQSNQTFYTCYAESKDYMARPHREESRASLEVVQYRASSYRQALANYTKVLG